MLSVMFAAAIAAASAPTSSGVAQPSGKSADPLVCHMEPIEGSRITHKVCMRASQIAERKLDARWQLDRVQNVSQAPNMATMVSMGPMH